MLFRSMFMTTFAWLMRRPVHDCNQDKNSNSTITSMLNILFPCSLSMLLAMMAAISVMAVTDLTQCKSNRNQRIQSVAMFHVYFIIFRMKVCVMFFVLENKRSSIVCRAGARLGC